MDKVVKVGKNKEKKEISFHYFFVCVCVCMCALLGNTEFKKLYQLFYNLLSLNMKRVHIIEMIVKNIIIIRVYTKTLMTKMLFNNFEM